MNYDSFQQAHWMGGLAFFAAFMLTFWPSAGRLKAAAVLWCIGVLALQSGTISLVIHLIATEYAYSPASSASAFLSLIHLIPLSLLMTGVVLMHPGVSRERALRVGRCIFLFIAPVFYIILWFLRIGSETIYFQPLNTPFPVTAAWIGYAVLWFKIRENVKYSGEAAQEQPS